MSNAITIFRSLLIYGICLPLAVFLGYLIATPSDFTTFSFVGLVLLALATPLLLRWHHPMLIISWNLGAVAFFLPGRPNLWLPISLISLCLSLIERGLNKEKRFLSVRSVTWPLIFLMGVIAATAQLTGGIGLGSLGGEIYGGRRYFLLFGAVIGYFALVAHQTSPNRANLMVALFFLGGLTAAVGNLLPLADPNFYFIFLIFPPEKDIFQTLGKDIATQIDPVFRIGGLSWACLAAYYFMLVRYGIRGIFDLRKFWRLLILLLVVCVSLVGGFRSTAVTLALTFVLLFYFEGLFRSRLLPVLLLAGILISAVCLPMITKLPISIQRALSFLPIEVDPVARYSAEVSSEWRIRMWKLLLPEVPKYLLLGKGYTIDPNEFRIIQAAQSSVGDSAELQIVSGDYHNGPLSVILPLGILGCVGFIWFLIAATRVLYHNYRFGDPDLQKINTFLLAYFVARIVFFFTIFGAFYSEFYIYTGIIGLSISLNGGVRRPLPMPETPVVVNKFSLARAAR